MEKIMKIFYTNNSSSQLILCMHYSATPKRLTRKVIFSQRPSGTCGVFVLDKKKRDLKFTTTDTTTLPVVRNASGTHLINEIWISCRHDHHWDINQTSGQISGCSPVVKHNGKKLQESSTPHFFNLRGSNMQIFTYHM